VPDVLPLIFGVGVAPVASATGIALVGGAWCVPPVPPWPLTFAPGFAGAALALAVGLFNCMSVLLLKTLQSLCEAVSAKGFGLRSLHACVLS